MKDFINNLGFAKLGSIIGVTAAVLIGLMLIIFRLSQPPMSLLYSGLDFDDAGRIMQRLDQIGVPYEIKGNGTMVFAPKDQTLRLRMDLASEGLPSGGSVGYEIFDNLDMLGTTSFVQNVNRLRALEGELSRTIASLKTVNSARVHLVLPERSLFGKDKREPTASIMISGRASRMSAAQVQAVLNLVASAVPALTPNNISIIDQQGNLLASAAGENTDAAFAASLEERTASYQNYIQSQVEDIVSRIVGPDKVRVQVNAEIDFNRVVLQSETYDPESQVARSTQTIEESANDTEKSQSEGVSVSNNLPETEATNDADGTKSSSNSNRIEETVNFEISRTTKTETQEAGQVKHLSVAVAIDGSYAEAADGTLTYEPRTQEEMDRITALVRSTIGYTDERGDTLEVINFQFVQQPQAETIDAEEPFLGLTGDDYMRIGEIVALIIVAVILLLVFRTMLTRVGAQTALTATPALEAAGGGDPAQLAAPQDNPAIAGGQTAALPPPVNSGPLSNLDISQIGGAVKDTSVKKVGELVSTHPEESVAILRGWLHQA